MKAKQRLAVGIILIACAIIGLLAPFVILVIVRWDVYFQEASGTSVGMGFIVLLLWAVMMLKGAFKDIDKATGIIITLGFLQAIIWLLDSIIHDLFWVNLCALGGYIIYLILSRLGKRQISYHKAYKDEKMRVEARKEAETESAGIYL
jgi:hypothetical protein